MAQPPQPPQPVNPPEPELSASNRNLLFTVLKHYERLLMRKWWDMTDEPPPDMRLSIAGWKQKDFRKALNNYKVFVDHKLLAKLFVRDAITGAYQPRTQAGAVQDADSGSNDQLSWEEHNAICASAIYLIDNQNNQATADNIHGIMSLYGDCSMDYSVRPRDV